MDAYQQQNRFMRPPPPPSTADPHHPQPPGPPPPWLSNQFQHHPSQSPSPPPPHWPPPPPHSDHLNHPQASAYPPPPHQYSHQNQFPPRPYLPHPRPHYQVTQQGHSQEWGNSNWGHHQAYPVHNNEEDWAARAKAWATAKTAMDIQHPQPQFPPVSRPEEHGRYNEQYPQTVDSHYSLHASSNQHYHVTASIRPPEGQFQESASINPGPFSHDPDGHAHYTGRNGSVAGGSNTAFSHQQALQCPSVRPQEVPSSYSSVTGREQYADRNEHLHISMPIPASAAQEGQHHTQSTLANQPYAYGSQSANGQPDLSDQPLDFVSMSNSDHDPHAHATYSHYDMGGSARGVNPVASMPSFHSWSPSIVPTYPSVPSVLPSRPQRDPSVSEPSSVPPFGMFPGPVFQSSAPHAGTPYGLGAGNALHAATPFPGDVYGIAGVSERPKKAPVPIWLQEEIIKKKAVISSSREHLKEETPTIEDEGIDRSSGKGDQGDSRSIESSHSTEEEDDDEDYVEAARTAAINSEIKRILTEVLLKVTDELFDEIATKVISEDDLTVGVDHKTVMSNHNVSPSPPALLTPKASAKVLIPIQAKVTNTETSEKSNSSSPGVLLGLANYASDEDEEEEDDIEKSTKLKSETISILMQSNIERNPESAHDTTENWSSQREKVGGEKNTEGGAKGIGLIEINNNHIIGSASMDATELGNGNVNTMHSSDISNVDGKMLYGTNGTSSKDNTEENMMKSERPNKNIGVKNLRDSPPSKETRIKLDKNDLHESKRSSSRKDLKETGGSKIRSDENGDEKHRRQDEKHVREGHMDDQYTSKHRAKEQGVRTEEIAKETKSRKRSTHIGVKEERKEKERSQRTNAKENTTKKRERAKEEEDRPRQKLDSSQHKRIRSSSDSSQGRNSKGNTADQTNDSSDEASDDSRRKLHSRRQNLSPSPVRQRRRQVSRSPHNKHSQRRQSPYSSFETTRGRRSRTRSKSKSPVRRRR